VSCLLRSLIFVVVVVVVVVFRWEMAARIVHNKYQRPYGEYPHLSFDFQVTIIITTKCVYIYTKQNSQIGDHSSGKERSATYNTRDNAGQAA
jgi:hypothetical protein